MFIHIIVSMNTLKKICKKCDLEKELSEFGKNKTKKLGVQDACKECCNNYGKTYRELNATDLKEKRKERWANDKEQIQQNDIINSDELKIVRHEYYEKNKDKIIKRNTDYRKNN